MTIRRFGCSLLLCAVASCRPVAFGCRLGAQCTARGASGTCVAGFCAFSDTRCASGLRYDDSAGDGLAGQCAPTPQPDAGKTDARN